MFCNRICTGLKLRGCAKIVGVLWHKDRDGERVWGRVRSGGGRGGIDRDVWVFIGIFKFFCFSRREGFSKRKKAKKNEKSTKIVLCP